MPDYSITAVDRRVVYSGSAGTGPYAFTFPVLATTDIAVYKDSTKLTEGSGSTQYQVTLNASNGTGSVTLGAAATSDHTITITGARPIQRTTDFVTAGDLLASSLNTELDSQTIFVQQVAEDADRAIKAPVTDPTSIDMTLPAKADRLGKLMGFDSSTGNPEATTGRVNTVSVSAVSAGGTPTASFNTTTGALALGVVTGNTGAQGPAGDLSDPTTTQHDIIVRGASAIERLAKGSNSTVLNTNASGALAYSQVSTAMIADDAVTLAKMASGTDGNLISFDTSGNPAYVTTGSSGQVLTSNGAGAAPTFQAAAGGSLVHITTVTASNSASIDIASTLTDTYNSYFVTFANLLPASNNTEFVMLFSTDNGSSFVTGSAYVYNIKHFYTGPSGDGNSESTGDSSIRLALAVSSTAADGGLSGYMYIHSPTNSAVRTHVNFASFMKMGDGSNTAASLVGGGYVGSATDDDAFQIKNESGNITSGTVRVYGIENS